MTKSRIKRAVAAFSLALMMVPMFGSAALAADPDSLVETGIKEKVDCLFRVYIQEGSGGLDCLS